MDLLKNLAERVLPLYLNLTTRKKINQPISPYYSASLIKALITLALLLDLTALVINKEKATSRRALINSQTLIFHTLHISDYNIIKLNMIIVSQVSNWPIFPSIQFIIFIHMG